MPIAYVDTSAVVAIVFGESGGKKAQKALTKVGTLLSSNLLEAEFRAVLAREEAPSKSGKILDAIGWIHPNRPLTNEYRLALSQGYLRGADLVHIATALFFADPPAAIGFATLDERQAKVAESLGFQLIL